MSADATRELDEHFMARALRAASRGQPSPEPRVGAVIARGQELVSVAHRASPSEPHAACVALRRAGVRARGATLYCTLEPWLGVADDPCLAAIVAAGVKRVVVGCVPPALGSQRRRSRSGVPFQLVRGVLQPRAERLIADYRKFHLHGLPFVTLKAAVTLDGRTAARSGESKWITGPEARKEAHRMRVRADAVLVGVGTVLADDPELTVRAVRGRSPLRVVLDTQLRTPARAKLVTTAVATPTLILHGQKADSARAAKLRAAGVQLATVRQARRGGLDIEAALRELARRGVVRLLVEGGAHIHAALLDAGLVDSAAVFVAPRILADSQAIPLAASATARSLQSAFVLADLELIRCGNDVLFRGDIDSSSTRSQHIVAGPLQLTKL